MFSNLSLYFIFFSSEIITRFVNSLVRVGKYFYKHLDLLKEYVTLMYILSWRSSAAIAGCAVGHLWRFYILRFNTLTIN